MLFFRKQNFFYWMQFSTKMEVLHLKWLLWRENDYFVAELKIFCKDCHVLSSQWKWRRLQRDESCFENANLKRKTSILISDESGFEITTLKGKQLQGFYLPRMVCMSFITCLLFLLKCYKIMIMIRIMMTFIVSLQITLSGVQAMHFEVIRLHACDRWASSRQCTIV